MTPSQDLTLAGVKMVQAEAVGVGLPHVVEGLT